MSSVMLSYYILYVSGDCDVFFLPQKEDIKGQGLGEGKVHKIHCKYKQRNSSAFLTSVLVKGQVLDCFKIEIYMYWVGWKGWK